MPLRYLYQGKRPTTYQKGQAIEKTPERQGIEKRKKDESDAKTCDEFTFRALCLPDGYSTTINGQYA